MSRRMHPGPGGREAGVRPIKIGYINAHLENDNLDENLNSHLETLQKISFRVTKDRNEEIEVLKKDAEKIQSLKEVVNQRDTNKEITNIFSKTSRDLDELSGMNRMSSENRIYRRIQREREKFSAKNHFNVVLPKWNPLSDVTERKHYNPVNVVIQKPTITTQNTDVNTQPRQKGYLEMTSSARRRLSRPKSVPASAMGSERPKQSLVTRAKSASRSRRELEELSRIELSMSEPKIFTADDQRQSILYELRREQTFLQRRIASFVAELDRFNKKKKGSIPEHSSGTFRIS